MVGEPDAISTLLDGLKGVFSGGDALENDGELGVRLDLLEEFPLWRLEIRKDGVVSGYIRSGRR